MDWDECFPCGGDNEEWRWAFRVVVVWIISRLSTGMIDSMAFIAGVNGFLCGRETKSDWWLCLLLLLLQVRWRVIYVPCCGIVFFLGCLLLWIFEGDGFWWRGNDNGIGDGRGIFDDEFYSIFTLRKGSNNRILLFSTNMNVFTIEYVTEIRKMMDILSDVQWIIKQGANS